VDGFYLILNLIYFILIEVFLICSSWTELYYTFFSRWQWLRNSA